MIRGERAEVSLRAPGWVPHTIQFPSTLRQARAPRQPGSWIEKHFLLLGLERIWGTKKQIAKKSLKARLHWRIFSCNLSRNVLKRGTEGEGGGGEKD